MNPKLLLIIFYLIIALFARGQNNVELFAEKSNYLYRGVDNPVKVIYKGKILGPDEYNATIREGSCRKTDTALIIHPDWRPSLCITNDKGDTIYFNQRLRTKVIPDPIMTFNGKWRGGEITKRDLLSANGIVPLIENFDFEVQRLNVSSYSAIFQIGNETFTLYGTGPLISPEIHKAIERMRPYDGVEFTGFKFDTPWTVFSYTELPPISFKIDKYHPGDSYRSIVTGLNDYSHGRNTYYYKYNYDSLNKALQIPSHGYEYSLSTHREIKTNCNNRLDTCSMDIFYQAEEKISLAEHYDFFSDDSIRLKWYAGDKLLADINYSHECLSGQGNRV